MSVNIEDLPLSPPDNPLEAVVEAASDNAHDKRHDRDFFDANFGLRMAEDKDVLELLWAIESHLNRRTSNPDRLPQSLLAAYNRLMGRAYNLYEQDFIDEAKDDAAAHRLENGREAF